jgi:hypothetical protein
MAPPQLGVVTDALHTACLTLLDAFCQASSTRLGYSNSVAFKASLIVMPIRQVIAKHKRETNELHGLNNTLIAKSINCLSDCLQQNVAQIICVTPPFNPCIQDYRRAAVEHAHSLRPDAIAIGFRRVPSAISLGPPEYELN